MVWLQDQRILRRKTSIIPFYYFTKPLKYTELINVEAFNRNKRKQQKIHCDSNCQEFKGF